MARYGFIVFFGHDGSGRWNIILQEDGENKYYFTCDEDRLNPSIEMMELFLENGGNSYKYVVPTYDQWMEVVDDESIFLLPDEPIAGLDEYLSNPKIVPHFPATNATNCPNCDYDILENRQVCCPKCGYYFRYEVNGSS